MNNGTQSDHRHAYQVIPDVGTRVVVGARPSERIEPATRIGYQSPGGPGSYNETAKPALP
jgi:hypothetical protein